MTKEGWIQRTREQIKEAAALSYDGLAWSMGSGFFGNTEGKLIKREGVYAWQPLVRRPEDVSCWRGEFVEVVEALRESPSVIYRDWEPRLPKPPLQLLAEQAE